MIALDARRLTDALSKLTGVCDDLGAIARTTELEALGHAVLATRAGVYSTQPGAYERTFDLLRGIRASSKSAKNTASVTVLNEVDYAKYVELGTGSNALTLPQAQQYAIASPDRYVRFGRTGEKYTLPNPAIAGAQVYAYSRMQELFGRKIKGQM